MKQLDLGKTKISKIFWTYAIPAIFSMVATTTAHMIDASFVGNYVGSEAVASITLIMPIIMLLQGVAIMVAVGGSTYAGIELGKGNVKKSNNFFNITNILIIGSAILATVIMMVLQPFLGSIFNITGTTLSHVKIYSSTLTMFFIFYMMNFVFNFFLNIDRKPVLSVIILLSGSLLNILLDYVFIVPMGLGIRGAAMATGLSQLLPWIAYIVVYKLKSSYTFSWPKFNWNEIKLMLFNGSSELLSTLTISIAGMIINGVIIKNLGVPGVAAYTVALQVANLVASIGYGLSDAIRSGVSYNYGATKFDRVAKLLKYSVIGNLIIGLVVGVFTYNFGDVVSSFFLNDTQVISLSSGILKYYSFAFLVIGVNITLSTYYTGVDSPVISAVISFLRSFGILIPLMFLLPAIIGDEGIWLAILGTEFITVIVAFFIYKKSPYGKIQLQPATQK